MEDILAVILIFGGGTCAAISFSPIGRALADRLRGKPAPSADPHPDVLDELDRMRQELSDVQERLDFTERLLAETRERQELPGSTPRTPA